LDFSTRDNLFSSKGVNETNRVPIHHKMLANKELMAKKYGSLKELIINFPFTFDLAFFNLNKAYLRAVPNLFENFSIDGARKMEATRSRLSSADNSSFVFLSEYDDNKFKNDNKFESYQIVNSFLLCTHTGKQVEKVRERPKFTYENHVKREFNRYVSDEMFDKEFTRTTTYLEPNNRQQEVANRPPRRRRETSLSSSRNSLRRRAAERETVNTTREERYMENVRTAARRAAASSDTLTEADTMPRETRRTQRSSGQQQTRRQATTRQTTPNTEEVTQTTSTTTQRSSRQTQQRTSRGRRRGGRNEY